MNTATYTRPVAGFAGIPSMGMYLVKPVKPEPTAHKAHTQTKDCGDNAAVEKEIEMNNKVYICSPFRPVGETEEARSKSIKKHKILARYACRYAVASGYNPLCPHLYYPEFLDDNVEDEREIGMLLGMESLSECKELWIVGRRISEGMEKEIKQAAEWSIPIKHYIPRFTPEERLLKVFFGDQFPFIEMV